MHYIHLITYQNHIYLSVGFSLQRPLLLWSTVARASRLQQLRLLGSRAQTQQLQCTGLESEVTQWCPTLCNPLDLQAPLFMGFSRQEYWTGLPFPSPGDLPNPGIEPGSPALQADALPAEPPGKSQGRCEIRDLSRPGTKPKSSALAGRFFTSESPGASLKAYVI